MLKVWISYFFKVKSQFFKAQSLFVEMLKKGNCSLNDDLQKEFKLIKPYKMCKCSDAHVSVVTNVYEAQNVRMLNRLTSTRLSWNVTVIVKAIKLQQVKIMCRLSYCASRTNDCLSTLMKNNYEPKFSSLRAKSEEKNYQRFITKHKHIRAKWLRVWIKQKALQIKVARRRELWGIVPDRICNL